jgi:hypothetical protein
VSEYRYRVSAIYAAENERDSFTVGVRSLVMLVTKLTFESPLQMSSKTSTRTKKRKNKSWNYEHRRIKNAVTGLDRETLGSMSE